MTAVPQISNIPIPDPSVLTIEMQRRETQSLRDLIEAKIEYLTKTMQFDALLVDKNYINFNAEMSRLKELLSEKITGVNDRFNDADLRYKERFEAADLRYQQRYDASDKALAAASQAAQGAVNAALAAAKEAVQAASISAEKSVAAQNESNAASILKSEMGVTKQIDSINTALQTSGKTLDEKIAAINSRLDRSDGIHNESIYGRTERRLDTGTIIAIIVASVALLGVLFNYTQHNNSGTITVTPPAAVSTLSK